MHSIFAQLERHGDRTCLVEGDRRWTYAEAVATADGLFADTDLPRTGLAFLQAHMTADAILAYIGGGPARLRGASARPRQDRGHRAADRALTARTW